MLRLDDELVQRLVDHWVRAVTLLYQRFGRGLYGSCGWQSPGRESSYCCPLFNTNTCLPARFSNTKPWSR